MNRSRSILDGTRVSICIRCGGKMVFTGFKIYKFQLCGTKKCRKI